MTFSIRILCALLFLALPIPQAASAATKMQASGGTAKNLQRAYADMESFQANFVQKLTHRESGSVETRTGTLLFKKPLLARWETATPHAEIIIINNEEVWNYLPDESLAYRYAPELAQGSHMLIRVVTGQARPDQDFYMEEDGKEENLLRLRLYPLEPTQQITEIIVWVEPSNYLIKKAVILDFYGNGNEMSFTDLHPNPKIDEKSFDFTPPKGTTIEDRRTNGIKK